VGLYGYSIHENDTVYVVMEYCAQSSLDKLLYDSQDPLPYDQKIIWIKQIAAGLHHLHENQVIHRDIAARNILMSNKVAKLSDFRMSRHITVDKGITKSEVGPLRWMAPESIRDRVYSSKTDVWMFGCCVYEILIQQEPHLNGDAIQVAIKIQNENLTPEIPATLDTKMATLLQSCWSPIPANRPIMADIITHLE
jgi:serine/threonine protein kinase